MSDFPAFDACARLTARPTASVWTALFLALGLGWSDTAQASAPPEGTGTGVDAASSGSDAIAGEGSFATVAEGPEDSVECLDSTDLTLSAGGMFATGNATSIAITGRGDFRLRRHIHQFSTTVLGNYGAGVPEEAKRDKLETVVGNVQGQVRYDVFFHERWAAFLMLTGRHDRFQGLDIRTNLDPGVAFYAVSTPDQRLWFELGYDYRFEFQTNEFVAAQPRDQTGPISRKERMLHDHAGRLFAGYSNQINKALAFIAGLEYTQSFVVGQAFRINFDAGINAQVAKRLSFAVTFQLRYNHEVPTEEEQRELAKRPGAPPLELFKRLDTITAFNVVFKL